jgi:DNA-binding NtrC family response regulator
MSAIRKPPGIAGNDRSASTESAVLAISAFEEDLAALARMFRDSQFKLYAARNCPEGFSILRKRVIPIVIAEKDALGGGWKTILHETRQYTPVPKLIVTYRFSEASSAVETLRHGAYHVLAKPIVRSELFQGISFAWLQWRREWEQVKGRDVRGIASGS